jgi:FkbH-like protein
MTSVVVVSDFNAELVARYLSADRLEPLCTAVATPYGQLFQSLRDGTAFDNDAVAFIWSRPESVSPAYKKLIDGEQADPAAVLADVAAWVDDITRAARRARLVLVASWIPSQVGRGLGMLDWTAGGRASSLARMNARLSDGISGLDNVFVLDAQRWLDAPRAARDAKYWLSMKCPFNEVVCQSAAADVKAAIRGASGLARKLVVVDLDDTVWGGVVGDVGASGLRLGGHDAVGEAYVEFQRALKALSARGVALAVISKNDEAVALEPFDTHPEMALRRSDLAAWRINWNDKAANLIDVCRELNLGLQSVVFIDDNPAERGRIRETLPDVLVPEWPKDPARYAEALRQLDCFDQPAFTQEDASRTSMYAQARARAASRPAQVSDEDWLRSLDIRVTIEPVTARNITRTVQLANKTNQMNLRARRFTEPEFQRWLDERADRTATALSVADRFGDLGLTGLVTWQRTEGEIEIVDFVLSCRAMGRKVENLMAHLAVEAAREAGAGVVVARLALNERNNPCATFWKGSGFAEREPHTFVWDAARPYPRPDVVTARRGSVVGTVA